MSARLKIPIGRSRVVDVTMRPSIYVETTIPSYLVARQSRDLLSAAHQQITRDWWELRRQQFDLFISEVVRREAAAGDTAIAQQRMEVLAGISVLPATEAALELSEQLILRVPLPLKAANDAFHIAIATVHQCQYLLTWNCRHIANAELQRKLRRVARDQGFTLPIICTPEELMGE